MTSEIDSIRKDIDKLRARLRKAKETESRARKAKAKSKAKADLAGRLRIYGGRAAFIRRRGGGGYENSYRPYAEAYRKAGHHRCCVARIYCLYRKECQMLGVEPKVDIDRCGFRGLCEVDGLWLCNRHYAELKNPEMEGLCEDCQSSLK